MSSTSASKPSRWLSNGLCLTTAYLSEAYKHYLSKAAANENGEGYLKLSRPGEMTDVPTMTRASLLSEWEYFESSLFLTVVKGVSMMVTEGVTKLAPSFASGVDKAQPSPLIQNLFSQVHKHPRVAATPRSSARSWRVVRPHASKTSN